MFAALALASAGTAHAAPADAFYCLPDTGAKMPEGWVCEGGVCRKAITTTQPKATTYSQPTRRLIYLFRRR